VTGTREDLRQALRAELDRMEGVNPLDRVPRSAQQDRLRRRGLSAGIADAHTLTLVEVDGVLIWGDGFGLRTPAGPGLRRGLGGRRTQGEIIERVRVEPLDPGNDVAAYLSKLDQSWNADRGVRRLDPKTLTLQPPAAALPQTGRVLVLIHGTFSKAEALLTQLRGQAKGKDLLDRAIRHYDAIYAFDHPTVSVSPMLNAAELARFFRDGDVNVDVIAHSRGGLVTRWWFEAMDNLRTRQRRAVLVGCPLRGTSLATPKRLRDLLSWFTNVNQSLAAVGEMAAPVIPFLSVVTGLLRLTATVSRLASKIPLVDAGISMIPGLAAMCQDGFELQTLNVDPSAPPDYFVIKSNFEPPPVGWAFWRYFMEMKDRTKDLVADALFPGANDLVVDTTSMTYLGPSTQISAEHDFGANGNVWHTNYFLQPETVDFIAKSLLIP
jgi:hypothetical protein